MKTTTLITLLPSLLVTSIIASPVKIYNKAAAGTAGAVSPAHGNGDCYHASDGICYPTSSLSKGTSEDEGEGEDGDVISSVSGKVLQRPDGLFDSVIAWMPVGEHGGSGRERDWAGKNGRSLMGMEKGEGEGEEGEGDGGDKEEGDDEENAGNDDESGGTDEDESEGQDDDDGDENTGEGNDCEECDTEEDNGEVEDAENDADDGSDDDDVYSILPIPSAPTQTSYVK